MRDAAKPGSRQKVRNGRLQELGTGPQSWTWRACGTRAREKPWNVPRAQGGIRMYKALRACRPATNAMKFGRPTDLENTAFQHAGSRMESNLSPGQQVTAEHVM